MASLTFSLDDTRVRKKLSGLSAGVRNFKKPFDAASSELLEFYGEEVFASQGSAIGEPWRALAASTLAARAGRRGYYRKPPVTTDKILVWTGRLKKGFAREVTSRMLRIFNDVPYFKYHQKASGSPPQRRMLAINKNVITKVIRHVQRHVRGLV